MKTVNWPTRRMGGKWLKLYVLCKSCGIEVDKQKLHSALGDAYYTAQCYWKLMGFKFHVPKLDQLAFDGF